MARQKLPQPGDEQALAGERLIPESSTLPGLLNSSATARMYLLRALNPETALEASLLREAGRMNQHQVQKFIW